MKRQCRFDMVLSPLENHLLNKHAKEVRMSRSAFMRHLITSHADRMAAQYLSDEEMRDAVANGVPFRSYRSIAQERQE